MHIIHVKTLPLQTEFGKMPEWPNGTVSKTVVRVTVPRVRIPLSPLNVTDKTGQRTDKSHKFNDLWDFFLSPCVCLKVHFFAPKRQGF